MCICLAAILLPAVSLAEEGYHMREIPVTDVGPVCIGQTENAEAATGCTVFIAPDGQRLRPGRGKRRDAVPGRTRNRL